MTMESKIALASTSGGVKKVWKWNWNKFLWKEERKYTRKMPQILAQDWSLTNSQYESVKSVTLLKAEATVVWRTA